MEENEIYTHVKKMIIGLGVVQKEYVCDGCALNLFRYCKNAL